jgi:5-hydroxyisourate hydrolase
MTALSTHVLDTVSGRPAAGVPVTLTNAAGAVLAEARTDPDGRAQLAGLRSGLHRLRFDTAAYFSAHGIRTFYPEVVVAFTVTDTGTGTGTGTVTESGSYHVALLLSPYAYSTYRGS